MLDIGSFAFEGTEEEYRGLKAYHYSLLSKFEEEGFNSLPTLFEREERPSFLFGSIVDTLITDREHFDEKFYVADYPSVSASLRLITRQLYDRYSKDHKTLDEISDEIISEVCVQNNYYAADRYAKTRVNNVRGKCTSLYKLLIETDGRQVISTFEYFCGRDARYAIFHAPEISKYVTETDTYKVYNQVKLFDKVLIRGKEYPVKCMLDFLCVDEDKKVIYPIDLKTSALHEWEFPKAFKKYHYWIQSELYWQMLDKILKETPGTEGYSIADFQFLVVSRVSPSPMMWTDKNCIVEDDYKIGGKRFRHWSNIMEELDHYLTEEHKYPLSMKADGNNIIETLEKDSDYWYPTKLEGEEKEDAELSQRIRRTDSFISWYPTTRKGEVAKLSQRIRYMVSSISSSCSGILSSLMERLRNIIQRYRPRSRY